MRQIQPTGMRQDQCSRQRRQEPSKRQCAEWDYSAAGHEVANDKGARHGAPCQMGCDEGSMPLACDRIGCHGGMDQAMREALKAREPGEWEGTLHCS
jgi:hypothetical protein